MNRDRSSGFVDCGFKSVRETEGGVGFGAAGRETMTSFVSWLICTPNGVKTALDGRQTSREALIPVITKYIVHNWKPQRITRDYGFHCPLPQQHVIWREWGGVEPSRPRVMMARQPRMLIPLLCPPHRQHGPRTSLE